MADHILQFLILKVAVMLNVLTYQKKMNRKSGMLLDLVL